MLRPDGNPMGRFQVIFHIHIKMQQPCQNEKKKTGIKGFFTKKTISVASSVLDSPAWHCPHCKKILMWMNAKEP